MFTKNSNELQNSSDGNSGFCMNLEYEDWWYESRLL
jgi:hypothetical protein